MNLKEEPEIFSNEKTFFGLKDVIEIKYDKKEQNLGRLKTI